MRAMTPREFVAALRAEGLDAWLDIHGGPGYPAVPTGWLPDMRGWILSDRNGCLGDAGAPQVYDMPLPGTLYLGVYESPVENAGQWPGEPGLEFTELAGWLNGCTAAEAAAAVRRAAAGDYSGFTPARPGQDAIAPASLLEDLTTVGGARMFDERTRHYLRRVRLARPAAVAPWRTGTCPECGGRVHGGGLVPAGPGGAEAHVLIRGAVVLGCQGYPIVDPAAVGLDRGEWEDWRGSLDAAYINDEGDGYVVTLFGAYVGGRVATHPEALALLRAELENPAVPGAPAGWQPRVFYMAHATGLIVEFPVPLADVRPDWHRAAGPDDAAWYAALPPHAGVEAFCLLCGETFNPYGPADLTHGQRASDEQPCGGPGVPIGCWGIPPGGPAPRPAGNGRPAPVTYRLGHFTAADADALVGRVADITEYGDDELETTVTHEGAYVAGVLPPLGCLAITGGTQTVRVAATGQVLTRRPAPGGRLAVGRALICQVANVRTTARDS